MAVLCATLGLLVAGCFGGSTRGPAAHSVRLSITPAGGGVNTAPNRGITVRAAGGRISKVIVRTPGDPVGGRLNAAGTVWRSTWALNVSQRYTVTATAKGTSGSPVTRTSSFRTFTPRKTFSTRVVEGYRQTYGVGMPIILYFSRPVTNKPAVERALQISTSKPVVGAWRWDSQCGTAPECLYFRPRHYWRAAHARELHRSPERSGGRTRCLRASHPDPDVHDRPLADCGCEHRTPLPERVPQREEVRALADQYRTAR